MRRSVRRRAAVGSYQEPLKPREVPASPGGLCCCQPMKRVPPAALDSRQAALTPGAVRGRWGALLPLGVLELWSSSSSVRGYQDQNQQATFKNKDLIYHLAALVTLTLTTNNETYSCSELTLPHISGYTETGSVPELGTCVILTQDRVEGTWWMCAVSLLIPAHIQRNTVHSIHQCRFTPPLNSSSQPTHIDCQLAAQTHSMYGKEWVERN